MRNKIKMAFAALLLLAATIPVKAQTPSVEAQDFGTVLNLESENGGINWGQDNDGWIRFFAHNIQGADITFEISPSEATAAITTSPAGTLTWPGEYGGSISTNMDYTGDDINDTSFRLKIDINEGLVTDVYQDTVIFKQGGVEVGRVVVNLTFTELTPKVTFAPEATVGGMSGFTMFNYEDSAKVSLSCANTDAVITYNITGGSYGNTKVWQHYADETFTFKEDDIRIEAYSYAVGYDTSETATLTFNRTDKATVAIQPQGGAFLVQTGATITSSDGATIYYTTDDSEPTELSTPYTGKIALTATTTIKARAFKENDLPSDIATATYTLKTPVPVSIPYFSGPIKSDDATEANGYVCEGLEDDMADSACLRLDEGSFVVLAFNGAAGKLSVRVQGYSTRTCELGVYVSENGYEWTKLGDNVEISSETQTDHSFNMPASARFVRFSGENFGSRARLGFGNIRLSNPITADVIPYPYTSYDNYFEEYNHSFEDSIAVALNCATPGAKIYYTTDGNTPTTGSTQYSDSIRLKLSANIRAIAVADGYEASENILMARYNRSDQLQQVQFAREAGADAGYMFIGQTTAVLSHEDPDAEIRYTLDESEVTETSTLYTEPIPLDTTTRVFAKAYKAGDITSNNGIGNYTLVKPSPVAVPYFSGAVERDALTAAAGYIAYDLGRDMSLDSTFLRFDDEGDMIILAFADSAYQIQFKTGGDDVNTDAVLGVYASANGYEWTNIGNAEVKEALANYSYNLPGTARYIRLMVDTYTGDDYFGLGNIRLTAHEAPLEGVLLPITEDFSKFTEGSETNPVVIEEIISDQNPGAGSYDIPETYTNIPGWRGISIYQTGGSMRFGLDPYAQGNDVYMAWMSAPGFVHNKDKKIVVSLMARAASPDKGIVRVFWQNKDSVYNKVEDLFVDDNWKTYTVELKGVAQGGVYEVTIHGTKDYCFLDNLVIGYEGEMPSVGNEGIADADNGVKPSFFVSGNNLFVKNVALGSNIEIYNVAGQLMLSQTYTGKSINIGNLHRGLYLVRTGKFAAKIVK